MVLCLSPADSANGWSSAGADDQFGGFVKVIRPLLEELEGFFEKYGKKLPVADLTGRLGPSFHRRICTFLGFLIPWGAGQ
jgi:hypothetical protein